VEAVDSRQHHVEHDQIEWAGRSTLETALAVAGGLDGVALTGQSIGQGQDETGFILDEQHASHDRGGAAAALVPTALVFACSAVCSRPIGRWTVNWLPAAFALLTTTRPPCARTIRCTRLRPSPAPCTCAA